MGSAMNVMEVRAAGETPVTLGEAVTSVNQLITIKAADGEAYVATDAAGQVVAGINGDVGSEGDVIVVKKGEWILENDTVAPVTAAYIGKKCYFKDSRTVTISTGSHSLIAGTVVGLYTYGVKVDVGVDTSATPSS